MNRTEAIKILRETHDKALFSVRTALETLIPELEESEDEKVRKVIRQLLLGMREEIFTAQDEIVTKAKVLAWLENQKEQKPAEWKPLPESMEALLLAIEGKWDAIKPTGYMSRRLEDLYDGLVNTFDVDEKYLSNLPKTEYTEKDIEEIKALKEKIDSSMETKPAEWSEVDILTLDSIISIVEDWESEQSEEEKEYYGATQKSDFLKSLPERFNLQPKQEWSEEDEAFLKIAIAICNRYSHKDIADWLKSLRPSWKPSEEQMLNLKKAYESYDFCDGERKALESLYEQLKDLM